MALKKSLLSASIASFIGSSLLVSAPIAFSQDNLVIEELIVTARKKDEMLQDVPLTINAFSDEMLQDAGITTLQSLADFTPGFDFAQAFGRQDFRPAIRGQSNIQGGANAGLFVDGIYIGRGAATLPYGAIQTVEVVKGPQSTLYGRSTLAGAVNYTLKKPSAEFEGDVALTYGEDNELRTEITVSGPMGDKFGYMISASYYDFDGQYTNEYPGQTWNQRSGGTATTPASSSDIGGQETTSLVSVLEFQATEDLLLTARLMYEDSEDDPYAIGLLKSTNNNCFVGADVPESPTNPDYTDSAAYNGSGYYCGSVDVDQILDEGSPALNDSFYGSHGQQFEALRLSFSAEYYINDWVLVSNISWHDYDEEGRSDLSFGPRPDAGIWTPAFSPFVPPADGTQTTTGGTVYDLPFLIGATNFGNWLEEEADIEEQSLEFRVSSPDEDRLRFITGLFYYGYEESSSERNSSEAFTATGDLAVFARDAVGFDMIDQGTEERTNWAVFAQAEYDLNDDLTATLELRYNEEELEYSGGPNNLDYSETFESVLPRASINWSINPDMLAFFVIGKGNKPGDINTGNGLDASQELVDEEEAWNYEAGLKTTWLNGQLIANGAIFYTDWEDQQLTTTVQTDSGTRSILDNVGESEIYGLELELIYKPTSFWDIYAGYAYTDTEIKEFRVPPADSSGYREPAVFGFPYDPNTGDVIISGTEMPQVSQDQLTISNTFYGPLTDRWEWFARADFLYASKRYAQVYNLADTGSKEVWNLRAGIKSENIDIEAWVDNATDDDTSPSLIRYVEVADGFFGPNRAIGATLPRQRTAGITARYRF